MGSYTQDEEKKLVDYIVEQDAIHKIKGDAIWKQMEEEQAVGSRTWHSLKQHFRRKVIFELHYPRYGLDKETQILFRDHFNRVVKKNVKSKKNTTEKRSVVHIGVSLSSSSDDSNNEGGRESGSTATGT